MNALEACARDRGLGEIIGYVLAENDDMGTLMRARMYDSRRDEDDGAVLRYAKMLQVTVGNGNGHSPRNHALAENA
jgi:hypothetical protein